MNEAVIDFIVSFIILMGTFTAGVFCGMLVLISDVKKKGTLKMKSGILHYIPNDVLDSHRDDIQ